MQYGLFIVARVQCTALMLIRFCVIVDQPVDIRAPMAHADVKPLDSDDLNSFTVLVKCVPDVL